MNRYAVGIEYDGSAYAGWQTQASSSTVQGLVELALAEVADEDVEVVCAGRTDAGVHSRGQVAHFDTQARRTSRGWVLGANTSLPRDISILWARSVPAHFHARYSAEARTYRYIILNRGSRAALAAGRVAWVHRPLVVPLMTQAAAYLCGHLDFSAFRSAQCQSRSPVRRVERLSVGRYGEWVIIEITANSFLHHMVRNIAGLLIAVGRGEASPSWAREVLEGKDRALAAPTAPAAGLYFWNVRYPLAFGLPRPGCSIMIPGAP